LEIDLLVLGYGQFENTTKKCLESLIPQVSELNAQIYLLDNVSEFIENLPPDKTAKKS
jgi:hypothetical protein